MERKPDYTLLKKKIIKTDELLLLFSQKSKEVDHMKNLYQQVKIKFERGKNELNRSNLEKQTLKYNLREVNTKYEPLKQKHEQLQLDYTNLEASNSETINNLHLKYQATEQQLKECQDELDLQKSLLKTVSKHKQKKDTIPHEAPTELRKKNAALTMEVYELKKELKFYKDLQEDLKHNIQTENTLKDERIHSLTQKYDALRQEKQTEYSNLQAKFQDASTQILNLTKKIGQLEVKFNEKDQSANFNYELLLKENKEIKEINSKYEAEIALIKTQLEEKSKSEVLIQEKEVLISTPQQCEEDDDALIEDIMREVRMPFLISPMLSDDESVGIPQIQITPPSPVGEAPNDFVTSDLGSASMIIKKRKSIKKRTKVNILATLKALKKANINFTISNESIITPTATPLVVYTSTPPIARHRSVRTTHFPIKKRSTGFTSALKCDHEGCVNTDMLLKGNDKDPSLLGFFSIKKELLSRTCSTVNSPEPSETVEDQNLNPPETIPKLPTHQSELIYLSSDKNEEIAKSLTSPKNLNTEIAGPKTIIEVQQISQVDRNCDLSLLDKTSDISDDQREGYTEEMFPIYNSPEAISEEDANYYSSELDNTTEDQYESNSEERSFNSSEVLQLSECELFGQISEEEVENRQAPRKSCDKISNKKGKSRISVIKKIGKALRARGSFVMEGISNEAPPAKKRIAHCKGAESTPVVPIAINSQAIECVQPIEDKVENETALVRKKSPNTPKTIFKRPVCTIRKSPRLACNVKKSFVTEKSGVDILGEVMKPMGSDLKQKEVEPIRPCIRPQVVEEMEVFADVPTNSMKPSPRMPISKIDVLFDKLINFSKEEVALAEVVAEFMGQDPEFVAEVILTKVSKDMDTPDCKYSPAPIMTETQRTMLGFMSKLEKSNFGPIFSHFLCLAERRLLTTKTLEEVAPITRLYLAICKLNQDIHKMRKLCCEVFYFLDTLAIPFLFIVLTSWSEVLPHECDSKAFPLARILVQIVNLKDCNIPGYNLRPLKDLLVKFYGYPGERWDSNVLFKELCDLYLANPIRSADFALLLLCKNHPDKWVNEKIEQVFKPLLNQVPSDNFKAAVIILIGNLSSQFSPQTEVNYVKNLREWLHQLVDEQTPDVVRRSVYLCLQRLEGK